MTRKNHDNHIGGEVGNETGDDGALPGVPGGWSERLVQLERHRFRLLVPADPDRVLDLAAQWAASARAEDSDAMSDPFWATVWSAAGPTADWVFNASWPPRARVLELGCGAGLVGLAALARGLEVTFSDHVPIAVALAAENARRNGLGEPRCMVFDWSTPPQGCFQVILASDVLYDPHLHAPLLHSIGRLLADDGVCWIGDPGRSHVPAFLELARRRFTISLHDQRGDPVSQTRIGRYQRIGLRAHVGNHR